MNLTDKIDSLVSGTVFKNPYQDQVLGLQTAQYQLSTFQPESSGDPTLDARIQAELIPLKDSSINKTDMAALDFNSRYDQKKNTILTDLPLLKGVATARDRVAQIDGLAGEVEDVATSCVPTIGQAFQSMTQTSLSSFTGYINQALSYIGQLFSNITSDADIDFLKNLLTQINEQFDSLSQAFLNAINSEDNSIANAIAWIRSMAFVQWIDGMKDDDCITGIAGGIINNSIWT